MDYAVHELSRDPKSGDAARWSQFPIEGSRAWFKVRETGMRNGNYDERAHYLKGVPATAVDLIRNLQPCYGCTWTKELADLSNPDKHRHLASLRSKASGRIVRLGLDPETDTETIRVEFDEVAVLFEDRRPVLGVLRDLSDKSEGRFRSSRAP